MSGRNVYRFRISSLGREHRNDGDTPRRRMGQDAFAARHGRFLPAIATQPKRRRDRNRAKRVRQDLLTYAPAFSDLALSFAAFLPDFLAPRRLLIPPIVIFPAVPINSRPASLLVASLNLSRFSR